MHGLSSRRPRRDCWPTRIKSLVSTQHGRSDKDWIALPVFLTGAMPATLGLVSLLLTRVNPQAKISVEALDALGLVLATPRFTSSSCLALV